MQRIFNRNDLTLPPRESVGDSIDFSFEKVEADGKDESNRKLLRPSLYLHKHILHGPYRSH